MANENLYDPALRKVGRAILYELHARGVRHMVFGGHAVLLYVGYREFGVRDLDIVIEPSDENATKIIATIHDYYPEQASEVTRDRLTQPRKKWSFGQGIDLFDIVTSSNSQTLLFDDLWRDRREVSTSIDLGGMKHEFGVPFVSKDHLIQLKLESINDPERLEEGKEKDRKDLESLRRLP